MAVPDRARRVGSWLGCQEEGTNPDLQANASTPLSLISQLPRARAARAAGGVSSAMGGGRSGGKNVHGAAHAQLCHVCVSSSVSDYYCGSQI